MRRTHLFLLLLVALSFGLRVFLLGSQELRGDEGFSWNYIQGPPDVILHRIIAEGDPQPPLHYWLLWGWTRLGGDSEFSLRFSSAFLSLLLVPLMYQVGRKLLGRQIGLLAATLTTGGSFDYLRSRQYKQFLKNQLFFDKIKKEVAKKEKN